MSTYLASGALQHWLLAPDVNTMRSMAISCEPRRKKGDAAIRKAEPRDAITL